MSLSTTSKYVFTSVAINFDPGRMDKFWEILCCIICQLLKDSSLSGFLQGSAWSGYCSINVTVLVKDIPSTYIFRNILIW